jgi:hypothetical protein
MAHELTKVGYECSFVGPEAVCGISIGVAKKVVKDWTETTGKTRIAQVGSNRLGLLKWAQTGSLCQENKGAVNLEQRPATKGGRTIHRTLSPKGTTFQIGINK